MKAALTVLAVAVVGATSAAVLAASPTSAQRVPQWLLPNAVAFFDRTHGVLGTGYRYSGHNGGSIELTSDGGRTWHVTLRTPRPVVSLTANGSFLDAQLDDGEMLQSHDEGRTWRPTTTPAWPPGASVCPMGLVVGINAGDSTWSLCSTSGGAGNEGKEVFRLGGRGWKRVACTNFANTHFLCGKQSYGGIASLGYPLGIAGNVDGFGLIWESRGTIWVTRDGGRHWTRKSKVAVFDLDFGSWAYVLPHGAVGFVVLSRGSVQARLIETTNGGRSWRILGRWVTSRS